MSHRLPFAFSTLLAATAACGGGTTPLDPSGGPVASITITPGDLSFQSLGITATLTAVARDEQGTTVSNAMITWAKKGSGVITVSASGIVTAVGAGTDSVIATSGTGRAAIGVEVQQVINGISLSAPTTAFTRALQSATPTGGDLESRSALCRTLSEAELAFGGWLGAD